MSLALLLLSLSVLLSPRRAPLSFRALPRESSPGRGLEGKRAECRLFRHARISPPSSHKVSRQNKLLLHVDASLTQQLGHCIAL